MKKIKIEDNKSRNSWLDRFTLNLARILGALIIFSWALNRYFTNLVRINQYYEVVEDLKTNEEKIEISDSFIKCLCEQREEDFESLQQEDNSSESFLWKERVENYLQERKINIHSLDIYMNRQDNKWNITTQNEIFKINFVRFLLAKNLNKLTIFFQSFATERMRGKNFLFYSEVFIKSVILALIIKILGRQERENPEKQENFESEDPLSFLKDNALRSLEKVATLSLVSPWNVFLINELPPSDLLEVSFLFWTVISFQITMLRFAFEEFQRVRGETGEINKEKDAEIIRNNLSRKLLDLILFWITNRYFLMKTNLGTIDSSTRRLTSILFLTSGVITTIAKLANYEIVKVRKRAEEKAL